MLKKLILNNIITVFIILILFCFFSYSIFYASVVRTIEEDELIKKGFDPKLYVEKIRDSKIIPTIHKDGEDIVFILDSLFENKEVTEEKYGNRSGTGSYSFMVKGKGIVEALNSSSRW